MTRILFVCMGNICRSPTVEAVARAEFARAQLDIEVASAGTEDYHVGAQADPRAIAVAEAAGYAMAAHRARQVQPADFGRYDLLLGMDRVNLRRLERMRSDPRPDTTCRPELFLRHAGIEPIELPDPYYGGTHDFELALELARRGIAALIARMRADAGSDATASRA
ncbi:MAG TPA: low molecular weight protein-tyrosine-phosphatase [Rhodanobacteraceae bacterium]|nr:low molecular weight protein-tyrosine-phosphatase [Rhodanobacteraceae bacterium]